MSAKTFPMIISPGPSREHQIALIQFCYSSPLLGHEYPKISTNQFLPEPMLFLP